MACSPAVIGFATAPLVGSLGRQGHLVRIGSGFGCDPDTMLGIALSPLPQAVGAAISHFRPGTDDCFHRAGLLGRPKICIQVTERIQN